MERRLKRFKRPQWFRTTINLDQPTIVRWNEMVEAGLCGNLSLFVRQQVEREYRERDAQLSAIKQR